jgi:hypothetical protein
LRALIISFLITAKTKNDLAGEIIMAQEAKIAGVIGLK